MSWSNVPLSIIVAKKPHHTMHSLSFLNQNQETYLKADLNSLKNKQYQTDNACSKV